MLPHLRKAMTELSDIDFIVVVACMIFTASVFIWMLSYSREQIKTDIYRTLDATVSGIERSNERLKRKIDSLPPGKYQGRKRWRSSAKPRHLTQGEFKPVNHAERNGPHR